MANPEPTKVFLKLIPDTAMLSKPFGCSHSLPSVPPFLLKKNLSLKNGAPSDITRLKFHAGYSQLHPGKR